MSAFFVRVYNFNDWLMFKADQSRDATIVYQALEKGPGKLPLLGPKMSGRIHIDTDKPDEAHPARLGPLYYYQQYFITRLIGRTDPWVYALGDLILSSLAILLFYYFSRLYFTKDISLVITILFAFSFYVIQYARFAWNPNQLLFWELLLMIGVYKSISAGTKKQRSWWFLISIVVYGIISQIHIVAAFGFLPVMIIFWLWHRPEVYKIILPVGLLIVFLLYTPVLLSEKYNDWDNSKRLVATLLEEKKTRSPWKKIEKLSGRYGEFSAIALSSVHDREVKAVEGWGKLFYFGTLFVLIFSWQREKVISLFKRLHQKNEKFLKKIITRQKEKSGIYLQKIIDGNKKLSEIITQLIPRRHLFVDLLLIWAGVYLIIFYKLVEDLNRARYFLVVVPLIFLFLGFWLSFVKKIFSKRTSQTIVFLLVIFLLTMNTTALSFWHTSLLGYAKNKKHFRDPKMHYHRGFITLQTMRNSLDYMIKKADEKNMPICYTNADYQYNKGMEYLQKVYYPNKAIVKFSDNKIYNDCIYFLTARLKNGEREIPEKIMNKFSIVEVQQIGAWNVWQLTPKEGVKTLGSVQNVTPLIDREYRNVVYWEDLWRN